MNPYLDLLLTMPLFEGISDKKNLAWVLKCIDGTVKDYRSCDVIFEEGEDVYFAGMVVSGVAQMLTAQGEASEQVDEGQLLPVTYDGEKSGKAVQKIVAKTDCKILFMRWIRLMKICNFECAFHKRLLENLEKMRSQK